MFNPVSDSADVMALQRSHDKIDRGFTNIAKGFVFVLLVTGLVVVAIVIPLMSADGPPEQSVTPFSTTDSTLGEVSFSLPALENTRIDNGQVHWSLPARDMLFPAGIGFTVGFLLLIGYSISMQTSFRVANLRRTVVALAKNPFTFVWSLLFACIAVLWHNGLFFYLSDKTTSQPISQSLKASFGGTTLLGLAISTVGYLWKPAWLNAAVAVAGGNLPSLSGIVSKLKKDSWFIGLFQAELEKEREQKISSLALNHNLGLIQKAICSVIKDELDHDRISSARYKQIVEDLQSLDTGKHERTRFISSRLAIRILRQLKELDSIEDWLAKIEERHAEQRGKVLQFERERRRFDRRIYSPWTVGSSG